MRKLTLLLCLTACANGKDLTGVRQQQADMDRYDDTPAEPEQEPEAAANTDADEPEADTSLRAIAVTAVAVQIDSKTLVKQAVIALPARTLKIAAFDTKPIAAAFSKTQETFTLRASDADRQVHESQSFKLLRVPKQGAFVLAKKVVAEGSYSGSEATLAANARASMKTWGIDDAEVGTVLSRKVFSQEGDDIGVEAPKLHRYKTFVERAVGGVPVVGHRAVISHGKDGSFARATVVWPPLAASGHKLATRLSADTISDRAKSALAAHGIAAGNARLRYKYLPTLNENGEAVLRLAVGARLKGGDGEAHEVDVEVDAE